MNEERENGLFNEKYEPCDKEHMLQYDSIRIEYLKLVLKTFSLMMSFKFSNLNSGMDSESFINSLTLTKISRVTASDTISVFGEILDFFLKLFEHENLLLKSIFTNSHEAASYRKLCYLMIDAIQLEFEQFFIQQYDYSKLANNSDSIVSGMVTVIYKVQSLQEKAHGSETDVRSALKILNFSLRLDDECAEILSTYLDAIKTGHMNTASVRPDCGIHEFCLDKLKMCSLMNEHRKFLIDSFKIVKEKSSIYKSFFHLKEK